MELGEFYDQGIEAHERAVASLRRTLRTPFCRLVEVCAGALREGGKILLFGNGGSAADAQHLATELTVRFASNRPALSALSLATDGSALTAIGNDLGFDLLFARQIEALARPGDVALAISTSGESENVIRGLKAAAQRGAVPAGLSGRDGGRMKELADPLLIVPIEDTARIQEMHLLLGHLLCEALEGESPWD